MGLNEAWTRARFLGVWGNGKMVRRAQMLGADIGVKACPAYIELQDKSKRCVFSYHGNDDKIIFAVDTDTCSFI